MRTRLCIVLLAVSTLLATDWPQFRGPHQNGTSNELNLPTTLDPNETQLWKTPLPGASEATPAVCGGRIYLPGNDKKSKTLFAMCLDANTGKPLWQHPVTTMKPTRRNSGTAPSPAADATGAIFLYADGTLVKFDIDGNECWKRNLIAEYGPLPMNFAYSSSLLLYKNRLYIAGMRRSEPPENSDYTGSMTPYLLAVDSAMGQNIFKVDRPTDAAGDFNDSYTTPIIATVNGQTQLLVFGSNYLTAHDPATGTEHWRYRYMDEDRPYGRMVSTPVTDNNVIYCMFPIGTKAFACDLSKLAGGESTRLWTYPDSTSDIPSPVVVKGYLYLLEERKKILICLDSKTGAVQWTGELNKGDMLYASITAGDGKLYMVNRKGFVTIVAADPKEFRILSTRDIGEGPVDSTPVIANGKLYIRTAENLYCFGNR